MKKPVQVSEAFLIGGGGGPGALVGLILTGLIVRPDRSEGFDFGDGVSLKKTPGWMHDEKKNKILGLVDPVTRFTLGQTLHCLWVETKTSLRDPATGEINLKSEDAAERLQKASLALWLSTIVSFEIPLLVPVAIPPGETEMAWDGPPLRTRLTYRIRPRPEAFRPQTVEEKDLDLASQLFLAIRRASGPVKTAADILYTSATLNVNEVSFLLLWSALEALFAPVAPNEATHRLRTRIALFLGRNERHARSLFGEVNDLYQIRSKMVHGHAFRAKNLKESQEHTQASIRVEDILRDALRRILLDQELLNTFDSPKKRDQFLDDLPFVGRRWPEETGPEVPE